MTQPVGITLTNFVLIVRHREEKLRSQNDERIRELARSHEQEEKQLLEEFSKAHDLLKARISELQIR